jgi:hypothetical protein
MAQPMNAQANMLKDERLKNIEGLNHTESENEGLDDYDIKDSTGG